MHEGYRDLAVELARTAGKLLITNPGGDPFTLPRDRDVVASNGLIHGAMLAVLHEIP